MKKLLYLFVLLLATTVHAEVSITFDDGFKNQIQNALPILSKYYVQGTVYVVTSFIDTNNYMNWWDLKTLDAHGWSIQDHTVSHLDLTKLSVPEIDYQLKQSQNTLRLHGFKANHVATPFGATNAIVQTEIKKYFISGRAAWAINGNTINDCAKLDRYNLTVIALNENSDLSKIEDVILKADRYNKWLILMVHNVTNDNCPANKEYSINTKNLDRIVGFCAFNNVHVVTIEQFFKDHGVQQ